MSEKSRGGLHTNTEGHPMCRWGRPQSSESGSVQRTRVIHSHRSWKAGMDQTHSTDPFLHPCLSLGGCRRPLLNPLSLNDPAREMSTALSWHSSSPMWMRAERRTQAAWGARGWLGKGLSLLSQPLWLRCYAPPGHLVPSAVHHGSFGPATLGARQALI